MATSTVLGQQGAARPAPGPLVLVRRYPLVTFFILAFALSWALLIPVIMDSLNLLPFHLPFPILLLTGWMPGLAAVLVTAAVGGGAGVRTLLRRIIIWRVGVWWYAAPILGSAALWSGGLALDPLIGGSGIHMPAFSATLLVGALVYLVLFFAINSEELAWRGFAIPRLQARRSALAASLVLGVFEGLFHLPYFFKPDSDQAATGLPLFVLGSMAGAVLFTWLFNSTGGSVLLAMLFHTFANMWSSLFPAPTGDQMVSQWAFNGLLVVAALVVVAVFGPARLSRRPASALPIVIDPPYMTTAGAA